MDDQLIARLQELENENTILKKKLLSLEKPRTPLGHILVPSQPQNVTVQATEDKKDVDDNILYYLKTVLGYNIKYKESTIILRSIYAFSTEDTFELEVQGNKLILKNTDYLQEWGETFNVYIKNGKSYSAFFAAVTLELYNRKTFGIE
ncbi:Mitotic spindle assembly checkpoint protein MAD1 [Glugoides intestinalis]